MSLVDLNRVSLQALKGKNCNRSVFDCLTLFDPQKGFI